MQKVETILEVPMVQEYSRYYVVQWLLYMMILPPRQIYHLSSFEFRLRMAVVHQQSLELVVTMVG